MDTQRVIARLVRQSPEHQARTRAEAIRAGLVNVAVLYAKAVEEEDWRVLGYTDIEAWREAEFGPVRFKAAYRKEIGALLTAKGWSQREIAAATGVSQPTIMHDQQHLPDPEAINPRQAAARQREEARREASPRLLAQQTFHMPPEVIARIQAEFGLTRAEAIMYVHEAVSTDSFTRWLVSAIKRRHGLKS